MNGLDEAFSITGVWPAMVARSKHPDPRRTKIVCTLGPETSDPEAIEVLVRAGMDVARLNMSHGLHAEHRARFEAVHAVAEREGRTVAVMADLCGPKIRIGKGVAPRRVETGDHLTLVGPGPDRGSDAIEVTLDVLSHALEPGHPVLVEDGRILLRVLDIEGGFVRCEVEVGGEIKPGKGVNLPGTPLPISALTPKDEEDLRFAVELGVDFVALSFVRTVGDILGLRDLLEAQGSEARIVAKIEMAEAIENLDGIVDASDAVMVARGDLGVEVGVAHVPLLQKRIIASARAAGKAVITATQMLETMIEAPVPTRAEVSDVANAILDGTSAVMLSAETATGRYPERAVAVMDEIARLVEPTLPFAPSQEPAPIERTLTTTACEVAERVDAALVAVRTRTGTTARDAAKTRPRRVVLAACTSEQVRRQLAMEWGIVPVVLDAPEDAGDPWSAVLRHAERMGLAARGDVVVLTGVTDVSFGGTTSSIALHRMDS